MSWVKSVSMGAKGATREGAAFSCALAIRGVGHRGSGVGCYSASRRRARIGLSIHDLAAIRDEMRIAIGGRRICWFAARTTLSREAPDGQAARPHGHGVRGPGGLRRGAPA